jgi:purine-nucleoside phosphorylase
MIRERHAARPAVALILGSGLGPLAEEVTGTTCIATRDLELFPGSTVAGHEGTLLVGRLAGVEVAVLKGRIHGYEGHPPATLGLPARLLLRLGARALVLTNAAGGIDPGFAAGDLMLISDHLGLGGRSPLEGPNLEAFGPRFPDMSAVYPEPLRALVRQVARELGITLREGVYAMMPGPQYETPAEVRMLRTLGADAVGMSTVPEAIVAAHMGVPVVGISLISNLAAGLGTASLSHDEVLEAAAEAGSRLTALLRGLLPRIAGATGASA